MFKVVLETTEVLHCNGFGLDHRSNIKGGKKFVLC
jgi:hypothetical protein